MQERGEMAVNIVQLQMNSLVFIFSICFILQWIIRFPPFHGKPSYPYPSLVAHVFPILLQTKCLLSSWLSKLFIFPSEDIFMIGFVWCDAANLMSNLVSCLW